MASLYASNRSGQGGFAFQITSTHVMALKVNKKGSTNTCKAFLLSG